MPYSCNDRTRAQEKGDFSILQPWQPSPALFGVIYQSAGMSQLASRQAALEFESTNIAVGDTAMSIQSILDAVADT